MKKLLQLTSNHSSVQALLNGRQRIVASDPTNEALLIASAFYTQPRQQIIIKSNLYEAQQLYTQLDQFCDPNTCFLFPVDESLRIEALAASPELLTARLDVLHRLVSGQSIIVVTHTAAIIRYLPTPDVFLNAHIKLKLNQSYAPQQLVHDLINIGYQRVSHIERSMQVATRGGVVDVYSLNYSQPIRIEFFGDEIDSIRFFDFDTQRTIDKINEVILIPGTDLLLSQSELENGIKKLTIEAAKSKNEVIKEAILKDIEYLSEDIGSARMYKYYRRFTTHSKTLLSYVTTPVFISNLNKVEDNYQVLVQEAIDYITDEQHGEGQYLHLDYFMPLNDALSIGSLRRIDEFKHDLNDLQLPVKAVQAVVGNGKLLYELIRDYLKQDFKVILAIENQHQREWISHWKLEYGFECPPLLDITQPKFPLSYIEQSFAEGFEFGEHKIVILTAHEIFGRASGANTRTLFREARVLQSSDSLLRGDYVVHETHGVGQYLGIETKEVDGIKRDYLHIVYRNDDKLYVPLEQFQLVRKFVSRDGITPRLNKLGSEEWTNTKKRIKKRVAEIAEKLMLLYAERVERKGHAFSKDNEMQHLFESGFPYELTPDQVRSVTEIKADMEQPYPMDRLLIGDVGFGKTEVAFIAAFKAISDGKQVAFLCPTTLLSQQHYERALERFKDLPVKIALLNRFVGDADQRRILRQIKAGGVQLVIGTHRLLSNDIDYHDLGLLIIDEEHRFGVEHKEKIKIIKTSIDVLTLTATPIPRTLQMALVGIRNLSQIDTPPKNRLPIQTYVVEKGEKLIKEIIERELARHGQVFYLFNHIDEIHRVANRISAMIPSARVIVVHGQMHRDEIEDAMVRFNSREANIMVCTTIIENGIDIPNANTIIIEDADTFGLSQLYQIKGRVGRSDRLAYAYLLYRPRKALSDVATKRLRAIKDFTELGSGYRIAMRDLSIRGAGDVLGAEQAGFIDTVGIDLYMRLLKDAIEERKSVKKEELQESMKHILSVNAYIPEKFSDDDMDKLEVYRQLNAATTLTKLELVSETLTDLYGKLPEPVRLLVEKRRFELLTKSEYVDDVTDMNETLEIRFSKQFLEIEGIGLDLFEIASTISLDLIPIVRHGTVRVRVSKRNINWMIHLNELLHEIYSVIHKKVHASRQASDLN